MKRYPGWKQRWFLALNKEEKVSNLTIKVWGKLNLKRKVKEVQVRKENEKSVQHNWEMLKGSIWMIGIEIFLQQWEKQANNGNSWVLRGTLRTKKDPNLGWQEFSSLHE